MLSAKVYRAVGELIRKTADKDQLVEALIGYFEQDNPKFNRPRFEQFIRPDYSPVIKDRRAYAQAIKQAALN